jgi:hypothetical protein
MSERVNIMQYAEEALQAMQTGDGQMRTVYVIVHTRAGGPGADGKDACPFDTTDGVFDDIAWEMGMADLKRFA